MGNLIFLIDNALHVPMDVLLSCQGLSKSFGSQILFEEISFGIFSKEKLGIIGPNGVGKSTLLQILAKLDTADQGAVVVKKGVRLVYVPQQESWNPEISVEDVLLNSYSSMDQEDLWKKVGSWLHKAHLLPHQKMGELSGGWQKRVSLIKALIQEPNLLLLDEPTNHLDLEGILWLEHLLERQNLAYVVISHDRYFLERMVNRLIEINPKYPQGILTVEGKYPQYLESREMLLYQESQKVETLSNLVRRENEWLSRQPKARTTKAKYRVEAAQQLQNDLSQVRSRIQNYGNLNLSFEQTGKQTKKLLEVRDLTFGYDETNLFQQVSFHLSPKSCLGIIGKNGSGKSTLLKIIAQQLQPNSGRIFLAKDLQIVLFDQHREQLDLQETLGSALSLSGSDQVWYRKEQIHIMTWAKRFLFRPDQMQMPLHTFSEGEKARVLLARIMQQPADLLLLDEPANNLDIPTLEILEESLLDFPGAIVLISHDRFLLKRLNAQILCILPDTQPLIYADYEQWEKAQQPQKKKKKSVQTISVAPAKQQKQKLSYKQQQIYNTIEEDILIAEEKVAELETLLQNKDVSHDSTKLLALCEQLRAGQEKVDHLYSLWDELESIQSGHS